MALASNVARAPCLPGMRTRWGHFSATNHTQDPKTERPHPAFVSFVWFVFENSTSEKAISDRQ